MSAISVGRVCIKTAGRDAGEKCVITKVLNANFVEIKSQGRKKVRRCAVRHLEPTEVVVSSPEQFGA
jgi:large subunit ribosomal protein L14e